MKPKKKWEIAPLGDVHGTYVVSEQYGYGIMDDFTKELKSMDAHEVYMQLIDLIHGIPENRLRSVDFNIENDTNENSFFDNPLKKWFSSGQTINIVIRLGTKI